VLSQFSDNVIDFSDFYSKDAEQVDERFNEEHHLIHNYID
jgi:hypothetical protein